jgi:hypothetical protein
MLAKAREIVEDCILTEKDCLDLRGSGLCGGELQPLFSSLLEKPFAVKRITSIVLHGTEISVLPDCVSRFSNLRGINLCSTPLSALPESVRELAFLEYLNIAQTNIPLEAAAFLADIPSLKKIVVLDGRELSFGDIKKEMERQAEKRRDDTGKVVKKNSVLRRFRVEPKILLSHFEKITGLVKETGFNPEFFEKAKEPIKAISDFFRINATQTVLFSLVLESFGDDKVSLKDLSETLRCGRIKLLEFLDDLEALQKKRLIRGGSRNTGGMFSARSGDSLPSYTVPLDVINAIRQGKAYRRVDYVKRTPEEFFDSAEDLLIMAREDNIRVEALVEELAELLEQNKDFCFFKKQKEYGLHEGSCIVLLIFCCAYLHGGLESLQASDLRPVLGIFEARQIERRFKSRKHKLIIKGLIENDGKNGLAGTNCYRMTEKARNEFLADVDMKAKTKHRGNNVIPAEKLAKKKLFYSEKVTRRIAELTTLLREENFGNVEKRLKEHNMRTGFACLFSGPPGTGKTETVYQIARETGRDIMLVDVSQTKSMWFGESEKCVKALFDRYRGAVKNGGPAPILLFNEADAVLGKRQELGESRSGPGQTENAIQNIILQELEDLEGILIATTNMTGNLDKAFERRFLYKIEFEKPDLAAKQAIWRSIMPGLSGEDTLTLSKRFEFSGGQIENIVRKQMVSMILSGVTPDLREIIACCEEELIEQNNVKKIGFCAE